MQCLLLWKELFPVFTTEVWNGHKLYHGSPTIWIQASLSLVRMSSHWNLIPSQKTVYYLLGS
jgi:hypothetical protein